MILRYASAGRFGVGTPQSNPTVEPELSLLLPRAASLHTVRLTSAEADPLKRLCAYLENLDTTLGAFDGMRLDAFGFACTGSSYLLGAEREAALARAAAERFGYPVLTAADAIVWTLTRLGARKVALLAPYPERLVETARAYFSDRGFLVTASSRVVTRTSDTRSIYELSAADAADALGALADADSDAILVSGTGMPSLAVVDPGAERPIVSSNFCLAARMLDAAGRGVELDAHLNPKGWRKRLGEALGEAGS